jgi:hypothetical protein
VASLQAAERAYIGAYAETGKLRLAGAERWRRQLARVRLDDARAALRPTVEELRDLSEVAEGVLDFHVWRWPR